MTPQEWFLLGFEPSRDPGLTKQIINQGRSDSAPASAVTVVFARLQSTYETARCTWDDVRNTSRNLAVFESSVLDLELLAWLDPAQITFPSIFNDMKVKGAYSNIDITMHLMRRNQMQLGHCLQDMISVGFIDTNSIGCVASQVLLYLSLIFILGVILIRFAMAVLFQWFFSHKLGNFLKETYEQRMQRSAEIEAWTNDIYKPAPSEYRPNVGKGGLRKADKRKTFLPSHSRFTPAEGMAKSGRLTTAYGQLDGVRGLDHRGQRQGKPHPAPRRSRSIMSWGDNLAELILVRDLYGTFCFSMQFVVCMELAGTLVLPAAITFTLPHRRHEPQGRVSRVDAHLSHQSPDLDGVLPTYAFWHLDDFSWDQTRKVDGEEMRTGDQEGEFCTSTESNRYSLTSNSDTFHPPSGMDTSTVESTNYNAAPRQRHDSNTLLMLPTPLAVSRNTTASASSSNPMSSSSSVGMVRSSEEGFDAGSSAHRLIGGPPWTRGSTPSTRRAAPAAPAARVAPGEHGHAHTTREREPVLARREREPNREPEESTSPSRYGEAARGVRLTDNGLVPGPEGGVRRVARPSARRPLARADRAPNSRSKTGIRGTRWDSVSLPGRRRRSLGITLEEFGFVGGVCLDCGV
ncbi:hypothetical protein C8R44DRAFT_845695, partial [Mycena epipterygia]